jgi:hypothetical protein
MRIVPAFDELKNDRTGFSRGVKGCAVQQLALQRGEEAFTQGIVKTIANRAHRGADASFPAAAAKGQGGVLATVIGVMDDLLGMTLLNSHVQGLQDQLGAQVGRHGPTDYPPAPGIDYDGQVQEPGPRADVGNINGLITNDKFCMIRHAKLKLRAQPSYPLCNHPAHQPDDRYPSDETFHAGGNHETSMAGSPRTQALSGWTTTLGSRLSVPPAMDPQLSADGEHSIDDPGATSGGAS